MVSIQVSKKDDDESVNGIPTSQTDRLALGNAESPASADLTSATAATTDDPLDNVVQEALNSPHCPKWTKRWLRETQGKDNWGFVRYIDQGDIRKQLRDEEHLFSNEIDVEAPRVVKTYNTRTSKVIESTLERAGCGDAVATKFKFQDLEWPQSQVDDDQLRWDKREARANKRDLKKLEAQGEDGADDDLDLDDRSLRKRDDLELVMQKFLDGDLPERLENDAHLRAKFRVLKRRFRAMRDALGTTPPLEEDSSTQDLEQGILRNVFIVVDKACIDSQRQGEGGWVFAVDPDYQDPGPMEPLTSKVQNRYRGFVRVRLQDLLEDFFVARKYQELERPMKELWKQARKEGDGLFVPTSEHQ